MANKLFIQTEDGNVNNCALNGWIRDEAATRLFDKCGLDYEKLTKEALNGDFKAVSLNLIQIWLKNNFDVCSLK